jgi:acetyl-CoA synthetase
MKANGVKKGDRVTIYMPMIPEAAYAMLACARIGAVHSIVFGGFSPDAWPDRIEGVTRKLSSQPMKGFAAAARFR